MEGKVIAITGGASGIALELAKILAARGAKVSIADVQAKALDDAAAAIKTAGSSDVFTAEVDVRNVDAVSKWIKDTVDKFGKLDGAANLAGVFRAGETTIETEDEKTWDFMIGVNLTGLMHCLRAQIPHLQSGASIVNAASILSLQGSPTASAYSASKHGVVGLTRSAAKDVGPKGIRVNCIAP
jgi:NAD(P)-dependent dehydrogenase (short-subunit alcohol dehydrogenase family)